MCTIMYVSTTKLFKLSPWFDLDLFYAKVNLVTWAFEWEKAKIIIFFLTLLQP